MATFNSLTTRKLLGEMATAYFEGKNREALAENLTKMG